MRVRSDNFQVTKLLFSNPETTVQEKVLSDKCKLIKILNMSKQMIKIHRLCLKSIIKE